MNLSLTLHIAESLMLKFSYAGGGCGVGLGLGWGFGSAFGSQYRSSRVTFQGLEFSSKGQNDEKELRDRWKTAMELFV